MIALVVGTLLSVGALAFVLWPLFSERPATRGRPSAARAAARAQDRAAAPRQLAVDALREIEFDRATGKLSDADYAELKGRYTQQALVAMRAEQEGAAAVVGDDELEAEIRRHRAGAVACPTCGPRPEPDAIYCSTCGTYLAGHCASCGAKVGAAGARYCPSCGHWLAA